MEELVFWKFPIQSIVLLLVLRRPAQHSALVEKRHGCELTSLHAPMVSLREGSGSMPLLDESCRACHVLQEGDCCDASFFHVKGRAIVTFLDMPSKTCGYERAIAARPPWDGLRLVYEKICFFRTPKPNWSKYAMVVHIHERAS